MNDLYHGSFSMHVELKVPGTYIAVGTYNQDINEQLLYKLVSIENYTDLYT